MTERTGEAYEFDERLTVVGHKLEPGDRAPDFELAHLDPATDAVRMVNLVGGQRAAAQRRQLARHAGLQRRDAALG